METPVNVGRRALNEILADLAKPIPVRHLKSKRQGGADITFCPWYNVIKILQHYTGGYFYYAVTDKMVIRGSESVPDKFLITVRLTIEYKDENGMVCEIFRDGTGINEMTRTKNGQDEDIAYGDLQSNAEGMALRRAASKLGLGLHLYDKDDPAHAMVANAKRRTRRRR